LAEGVATNIPPKLNLTQVKRCLNDTDHLINNPLHPVIRRPADVPLVLRRFADHPAAIDAGLRACTIPIYDSMAPGVGLIGVGAWVTCQLVVRRAARELSDVVLAPAPVAEKSS
jgi:hypothetical protein